MSEAIVVGGGLAGAAFAITLARQGRPVIVLEKTTGAHHKVCGEFLSAEA
jgi:menaquinone-9 beta-reductase